jgi:hypothetical protein
VRPHPKGSTKFPTRILDAVYDRCELWLRSVCAEGIGRCSSQSTPARAWDLRVLLTCEHGPSWHGNCSIPRVKP